LTDTAVRTPSQPDRRRRRLLGAGGALLAGGGWLRERPAHAQVPASDRRPADLVSLTPDIAPLVRLIEDTPRDRLPPILADRVRAGLPIDAALAAVQLAGVRNIQPRPVGFKFHAVLVVHAAHEAAKHAPAAERWLPLLWAIDEFKSSQLVDVRAGDWSMGAADAGKRRSAPAIVAEFGAAMDAWDEPRADRGAAALARDASPQVAFDTLARHAARDLRDIGHKAIHVANGWRVLQSIGWRRAEPMLRSMAYAALNRGPLNPALGDFPEDRPWRTNEALLRAARPVPFRGDADVATTSALLDVLRGANAADAARVLIGHCERGVALATLTDACHLFAAELLMKRPSIVPVHAVTTTNALHYAARTVSDDHLRRMLLLQNAAFLVMFRDLSLREFEKPVALIDRFAPEFSGPGRQQGISDTLAELDRDRRRACAKSLAWQGLNEPPHLLVTALRRLVYHKGQDAHDYKLGAAMLEDFGNVSPAWRARYLAAYAAYANGPGTPANPVVAEAVARLS